MKTIEKSGYNDLKRMANQEIKTRNAKECKGLAYAVDMAQEGESRFACALANEEYS